MKSRIVDLGGQISLLLGRTPRNMIDGRYGITARFRRSLFDLWPVAEFSSLALGPVLGPLSRGYVSVYDRRVLASYYASPKLPLPFISFLP